MDKAEISKFRREWESLKLTLLMPARLTDRQCDAILRGRIDRKDDIFFTEMSGTSIAHFKEDAADEIMGWAKKQINMHHARMDECGHAYVYGVETRFLNDAEKIHYAILRKGKVVTGGTDIGLFIDPLTPHLHRDRSKCHENSDRDPFYAWRLGSLPMWYISGKNHAAYEPVVRQARYSRTKFLDLTRSCGEEILQKAPLGDVVMGFTPDATRFDRKGMWHCSSPVPPGGVHSAFGRAWTINRR